MGGASERGSAISVLTRLDAVTPLRERILREGSSTEGAR